MRINLNVADVCGRLKKYNAQFMLAHALKEIKEKELQREYVENKGRDIDKKQVKRR